MFQKGSFKAIEVFFPNGLFWLQMQLANKDLANLFIVLKFVR